MVDDLETILDDAELNLKIIRETSDVNAKKRADTLTAKALTLAPKNDRAHYLRGFFVYRMGLEEQDLDARRRLYDKAITHYETAIRLNPQEAKYHGNVGYIHWLMGDTEKAQVALKQASILNPAEPIYDHLLGFVYEKEDRLWWAIKAYETAETKYESLTRTGKMTKDQQPYAGHIAEDLKRCRGKLPAVWWPMENGRVHDMGAPSLYM